ncbi:MAG: hypothetical protein IJV98_01770 [Clostridia bacterium]|nr:hypothetical protein [Clostridia bacterium]
MKIKQLLALLLAVTMLLGMVACGDTDTPATTTEPDSGVTTTEGGSVETTTGVQVETVLATQAVVKEEITLPLDEIVNAISIEADPVTETKEIPLLIILANFDADGDGEDDWDPANPSKLYSDKTKDYYGEQWAGSDVTDHYKLYFGDGYSLSNYYEEMTMGAFRFVPIPFDVVPEGSPYTNGIIEVVVDIPHPSASGDAQGAITAVFEATDDYIDYTKYDLNKNHKIDSTELGVVILNPGVDASNGTSDMGGKQKFQVHGTSQSLNAYNDGLSFSKVSNFGEYGSGQGIMQIGTPAHELAHNLGAEDLYDTNRNGHGGATVSGWPRAYNYSLESNGNHLSGGTRPAYLDPYHRIYLGWADYEVVEDGVYTIHSTMTDKYKVLRVNTPDPGEYYLIEIRFGEGFETALVGGASKGGIMIWHIDQDLCDRYFVEGSASTSTAVGGKRHDPAIVPLFREGYDIEGRYMNDTTPSDPCYYYDPENPEAAVFDSGFFHSVTNGTQSLNSYPADWEGPENYNLHVEVLSAPGSSMTVKITSGRKDFAPKLTATYSEKNHTSITVQGQLAAVNGADITACAVMLSTSADFSTGCVAMNATMAEDGKSFTATFTDLIPETKYYYKTYLTSDRGYVEATGDTTTSKAPQEKTNCSVSLFSDADARAYAVKATYGKTLEIPSGWLKSITNKKKGMQLEGWYYDAEFTQPYDMTKVIEKGTEDFSLYAKWVPAG